MFTGLLVFLLGLSQVSQASLLRLKQPSDVFLAPGFEALLPRQTATAPTPSVPQQCKPDCDPIDAQISQDPRCSPEQCCMSSFVNGYFNCLKCAGTALSINDYTPAQNVLDNLTQQCRAKGFSAPKLTLPGIDPNRTLPPLAPSPTVTSPVTATPIGPNTPAPTSSTSAPQPAQQTSGAVLNKPPVSQFPHLIILGVFLIDFIRFLV